jgi:hypothetical protein
MKKIEQSRIFENQLREIWRDVLPFPRIKGDQVQIGSVVEFAKSRLKVKGFHEITTWRSLIRGHEPSWISTKVFVQLTWFLNSSKIEVDFGEDPRLFIFGNQAHAMIQIFDETKKDIDIQILNLETGQRFSLHSPFGFNGKNWVPFEFKGELHFLYALSPKVVLVLREYGNGNSLEILSFPKKFNPVWEHNLEESIGIYRGGSPALQISPDQFLGFSHAINSNQDIHAHRLGIYSLTMSDQKLNHVFLTEYKENFLIDAYGLQIAAGQVLLDGSMAIDDIHEIESRIFNFRMYFELSAVESLFRKGGKHNDNEA